ncbi:MAG TPA: alpha/beta fold hydrolase [Candidatus Dormibacteraeota bacterium]
MGGHAAMRIDTWNAHRRLVSTRAGDVACVDVGEGPAALFVHGLVVNGHLWRPLVAELGGIRRCIALDLPGHGATPAPPERDLSLPGLAETVDALCEALGLDEVDLVGNDTGGAVCQVVAARHPGRIRTLTLTNCDTHDNLPPPFFRAATERARRGRYAPALRAMAADPTAARSARGLGACLEDAGALDTAILDSLLAPIRDSESAAAGIERLMVALHADDLLAAEPALATLTAPTLVVWGTADPFFETRWAHWLGDLIPGTRAVVELEGARLYLALERAPELAGLLRSLWTGEPAALAAHALGGRREER